MHGRSVKTRSGSVVPYDARYLVRPYGDPMVKRSYAVVWSSPEGVGSGRLEPGAEGFELVGREHELSIDFADVADVSIARAHGERLRGLPVLVLRQVHGSELRIASLEGAAVLHELMQHALQTGVTVAA
jgi:hypothetical protein